MAGNGKASSRLLILDRVHPADAVSPEMRYLRSLVVAHAETVFDQVESRVIEAARECVPSADLGGASAVLLIGEENLYLGPRSLATMLAAIDSGAPAAVPIVLSGLPMPDGADPIFTLRGFEAVEGELLEVAARIAPPGHLPVSLWRPEAFTPYLEAHGVEVLLSDPAVAELPPGAVSAGLFHAFVDYYGQAREDILPFLPAGAREVLEVGCGRGLTGARIKELLGCRVTGIELNRAAAAEARTRLDEVITGDVTQVELGRRFDAVVATELVEHLPYPEPFLERLHSLLAPGGRAVLSIPNVGHWSVVSDLLAGRFDYLPIGLLCYTHFRFYTEHTLRDWLRRAGFPEPRIVPQRTELPARFKALDAPFGVDRESLSIKGFYVLLETR